MGRGSSNGGGRGGSGFSGGSRGGSFRGSSSSGRGNNSSGFNIGPIFSYTGRHVRQSYYGNGNLSPMSILIIAIIIVCVLGLSFITKNDITPSTVNREKLDSKYLTELSEWYDDSAMGWIRSSQTLENGLRKFYKNTGVQPYLVITDNINGDVNPTGQDVLDYANTIYDQMFEDEGHMVFVFQCQDGGVDYMMAACTGVQAKTVVDDEALEILYDYVDKYFYSDLDEDEMFATAFSKASERMMTKTISPIIVIAIVIGIIGSLVVIYFIIKAIHKRARERAAETERILRTSVDTFGDQELDDLRDRYDS